MTGPGSHAVLGASGAHRWMQCPGSVRLSKQAPKQEAGIYARVGTVAHALIELCLTRQAEPIDYLGLTLPGFPDTTVDEEMVEAVEVFLGHVNDMYPAHRYERHIERRFDLRRLNPPGPMFGTADFVALEHDEGSQKPLTVHVVDYKHGSGYAVSVYNNPQLLYYALGTLLTLPDEYVARVKYVYITVVQPRAPHPDGIIRTQMLSLMEVLSFGGELLGAAEKTFADDAPVVSGDHCRFCPAKAICPTQYENAVAVAQQEFTEPLTLPEPETLSDEQLYLVLDKAGEVESWFRAVRAYVQDRLEKGEDFPGYKLVEKRKTRRWVASDKDVLFFAMNAGLAPEDVTVTSLRTPFALERKLKTVGVKKVPEDLVESRSTGYTLVPDTDPRPAQVVGPVNDFPALPAAADLD